jgi:DnaJ-class molecular chaperone
MDLDTPVDIFTAITGGEIRIPSLERHLILKIPPWTNAGRSLHLRGKGMPHRGDSKTRGNLFVLAVISESCEVHAKLHTTKWQYIVFQPFL